MLRCLAIVVAALAFAGCLRPSLVECGELSCAPTQICHANRCLDPSQLASCEAVAEGATCDALDEPGRCIDGVCEIATCGDGYIDDELREECDNSVPAAHCIDFGYDLGRPACTACQPDATIGCTHFGWERIVDAPTTGLAVDGDTIAYLTTMGLTVRTPSSTVVAPGFFSGVHAAAGHVIAFDSLAFVDIVGGVATHRSLPPIDHARVGPDGTIYALAGCFVSVVTDHLTSIGPAVVDGTCARIEIGPPTAAGPRIYAAAGQTAANRVYRWDPNRGQFTAVTAAGDEILEMRFHGDRLWVATKTGAYTVDDTNARTDLSLGFGPVSIAFTSDATFFADNGGTIARVRGTRIQQFRVPGLITGDGELYAYRGPIYRFTGMDYGTRAALSSQLEVVSAITEADGSVVVATKRTLYITDASGASWTSTNSPSQLTRAFTGGGGTYFLSDFMAAQGTRDPNLYTLSGALGAGWTSVTVPDNPLLYGLWWAPADSTLFAVGDNDAGDAFLGVRRGTTMWETAIRTGCTVRGVHGTDSSHVIAVGGCNGQSVVWDYNGTQWTELPRPGLPAPLFGALRLPDGKLVVTGPSGTASFDGTTWIVDDTVVGGWVSGTSDSDIWVSGTFTSVQHFDGAVWSKLAVQASGPIAVTAAPDRVLFPGATEGFVELVR